MKNKNTTKNISKKNVSASKTVAKTADNATLIVKVIAVLGYIGAGFGILASLVLLFGGSFLLGMLPIEELSGIIGALAGAVIVVLAVIALAFSVFWIFVSRALWDHKNWARIVYIVFSAIGVFSAIFALPSSIVSLLIHGAIVYFLGFDTAVKALFE